MQGLIEIHQRQCGELEQIIAEKDKQIKEWENRYNELREHLRAVIKSHEE